MAQVLPAFYDSFTRGRKDAIDFQNLITQQQRSAQMFPYQLQSAQGYANVATESARGQRMNNDTTEQFLPQQRTNMAKQYGVDRSVLDNQANYWRGVQTDSAGMENNPGYYAAAGNPSAVGERFLSPKGDASNVTPPYGFPNAEGLPPYLQNGYGVQPQMQQQPYQSQIDYSGGERPIDLKTVPYLNQPGTLESFTDNVGQWNAANSPSMNEGYAIQKLMDAGLEPILAQYSIQLDKERGLPLGTMAATGYAESGGFRTDATSPKGAQGLMQIMPSNFEPYGGPNFDPNNAQQSLNVANKLFAERQRAYPESTVEELLRRYNGRMDLDYDRPGIDPKAREENMAYPGRVREAYQKLFNFSPGF